MRYRVASAGIAFLGCQRLRRACAPAQAQRRHHHRRRERSRAWATSRSTARGNAEIRRDEVTIFGDLLRYNAEFGRVAGRGRRAPAARRRPLLRPAPRLQHARRHRHVREARSTCCSASARRAAAPSARDPRPRAITASRTRPSPPASRGSEDWLLEAAELELDYDERGGQGEAAAAALLRCADPRLSVRQLPAREPPPQRRARAVLLADHARAASSSACRTTGTSRPSAT